MLMYIKPKPLISLKLLLKCTCLMGQNLHHLMLQHGKLLLLLLAELLLLLLHLLQQLLLK